MIYRLVLKCRQTIESYVTELMVQLRNKNRESQFHKCPLHHKAWKSGEWPDPEEQLRQGDEKERADGACWQSHSSVNGSGLHY